MCDKVIRVGAVFDRIEARRIVNLKKRESTWEIEGPDFLL